jgi:hypothetical protein
MGLWNRERRGQRNHRQCADNHRLEWLYQDHQDEFLHMISNRFRVTECP